jgi:hypothetical protein
VIENTLGVLHTLRTYPKTPEKIGCAIIEGAPHENKTADKGQITSERASS